MSIRDPKPCPVCKDGSILRKVPYGKTLAPNLRYTQFYIKYVCDRRSNDLCSRNYKFCAICQTLIGYGSPGEGDKTLSRHEGENHVTADGIIAANTGKNFRIRSYTSRIYNYIRQCLNDLYRNNPQLFLVSMCGAIEVEQIFPHDMTENEIRELTWELVISSNYECEFCRLQYDAFPSLEICYDHMKECGADITNMKK